VGEEIRFNGTLSHDNDENGESIMRFDWMFSDQSSWLNDTGSTPFFVYHKVGIYNVTLRVIDDEGSYDLNVTQVVINQSNRPPLLPNVTGPQNGIVDLEYEFDVISYDDDNDTIKYTFIWGDNTLSNISDFMSPGVPFKAFHKWTESGIYNVTVIAEDDESITVEEYTIEIMDPDISEMDQTFLLFVLFPLLVFIIILILLFDKKRKDREKIRDK
jgi:PKD repeat protein